MAKQSSKSKATTKSSPRKGGKASGNGELFTQSNGVQTHTKAPEGTGESYWRLFSTKGDGCKEIAKASDGDLNVYQVRTLRVLRDKLGGVGKPVSMGDLKEAQGCRREKSQSIEWIRSVQQLHEEKGYVRRDDSKGRQHITYALTGAGKKALERAEKAHAKATK
jgi:hypothetical protein